MFSHLRTFFCARGFCFLLDGGRVTPALSDYHEGEERVRIVTAAVLLVVLQSNCEEKDGKKQPLAKAATSAQDVSSYTLKLDGIGADIAAGTPIVAHVQIKKDGNVLRGGKVEVTLGITCGKKRHRMQQMVDNEGKITFAALVPDNSWIGDCLALASARADGQDLRDSKPFVVSSAKLPPLVAGLEYAVSALRDENGDVYNGFLSLHNCQGGRLLAITNDSNDPIFAGSSDGVAINSKKTWQYVIVGAPPTTCQLMLASSAGGTRHEIRDITSPPAADNVAYGKVTALQEKKTKLVIVTAQVKDGSLYVYDTTKDIWQSVTAVKWGDKTSTDISWTARRNDNRALLKIAQGSKNWWYLATQ